MSDIEKTAAVIMQTVRNHIEDTSDAMVALAWVEKNAGKRLTERNKPAGFRISKSYAMTHLENESAFRARLGSDYAPDAVSLLISYDVKNVTVPEREWFLEHNARHYDAAQERNNTRNAFLFDDCQAHEIAARAQGVLDAFAAYRSAIEPVGSDRYAVAEAIGLSRVRDERGISL